MKYKPHKRIIRGGFTLVELLMATVVMAIILSALAAFASAMSNADRETKNMSEQQAQIRYATLRLTELLRNASHIIPVYSPLSGVCIWTDGNMDGLPSGKELVYVEVISEIGKLGAALRADHSFMVVSSGASRVQFLEFPDETTAFWLNGFENGAVRNWLTSYSESRLTTVLPECSDVTMLIDPDSKSMGLSFFVSENGTNRAYDIYGTKRCSVDHALDTYGELDHPHGDDDL